MKKVRCRIQEEAFGCGYLLTPLGEEWKDVRDPLYNEHSLYFNSYEQLEGLLTPKQTSMLVNGQSDHFYVDDETLAMYYGLH